MRLRALAARGYDVMAIDARAPAGDLFRRVSLEQFTNLDAHGNPLPESHPRHLAAPWTRWLGCSRRGAGVHEHASDRLDEPTARWYLEHRSAAGHGASGLLEACLAHWRDDHAGLCGYTALREALDRRFTEPTSPGRPLYDELGDAVEQEEWALIDKGAIRATGF